MLAMLVEVENVFFGLLYEQLKSAGQTLSAWSTLETTTWTRQLF